MSTLIEILNDRFGTDFRPADQLFLDQVREQAVADVEFGFVDDKLILFQIRPFVENAGARSNARLVAMDESLRSSETREVDMKGMPRTQP